MDAQQNLYYALGILAYSIAKADGVVQKEEFETVHEIVVAETKHNLDFNYVEIIFSILQKDHDNKSFNEVYDWAMNEFELGKYHLTPDLKFKFISVIKKVAEAFPPNLPEEMELVNRFENDLKGINPNLQID